MQLQNLDTAAKQMKQVHTGDCSLLGVNLLIACGGR